MARRDVALRADSYMKWSLPTGPKGGRREFDGEEESAVCEREDPSGQVVAIVVGIDEYQATSSGPPFRRSILPATTPKGS
jgi:hypothetical protein